MPVGAGHRKKKTPSSHCRYIISQEALETVASANHIEFAPDSDGIPPKVLSFGQNLTSFGVRSTGKENQYDGFSKSVVEKMQDNNGFHSHSQVHCIPGGSWPYNRWNTPIPIM
ncbi:hypothetical protein L1987_24036 [Smallanthus sonchifolius]|uniref:Uncharacterized protein n=1 Tax=Smallanthus sonchifolius TaxID=185202 RepID=A0ACB9IK78_9ASTR|nr:hypothetical protein L1987_24036 [Smallanthus sonchifolius]